MEIKRSTQNATSIITSLLFLVLLPAYSQKEMARDSRPMKKDTLFFYREKDYIKRGFWDWDHFYINEKSSEEVFFFQFIDKTFDLHPNEKDILCPRNFIRNSEFYRSELEGVKINSFRLSEYLGKFVIYLVEESDLSGPRFYIRVEALTYIE